MSFIESLRGRAAALEARIALPESHDERVIAAAAALAESRVVRPVLILDRATTEQQHSVARATGAETILSDAASPLEHGHQLVASGHVDGCVAGVLYTSAEVLR